MSEDFSNAKRGAVVQSDPTKERITIRLDRDIVDHFRQMVVSAGGGNYQSLINNALRDYVEADEKALEKRLRKVVREELRKELRKAS
ncbi:MAG: BrnA antitoxin family protein [Granulosicoccus sp.]